MTEKIKKYSPAGATRTRSSGGHAGRRCRSGESTSEASIVTTYGDSSRRERCFDKEPQAVFIKALSGRRKPVTMGKNQSMFSTQPLKRVIFPAPHLPKTSGGIAFVVTDKNNSAFFYGSPFQKRKSNAPQVRPPPNAVSSR